MADPFIIDKRLLPLIVIVWDLTNTYKGTLGSLYIKVLLTTLRINKKYPNVKDFLKEDNYNKYKGWQIHVVFKLRASIVMFFREQDKINYFKVYLKGIAF